MSNLVCHPYHLVDESPWPLMSCFGGLFLTSGFVSMFFNGNLLLVLNGMLLLIIVSYQWWLDVSSEGVHQGLHTFVVQSGLRWGMMLFIISEIFFFVSFFWAFFHSSLAPASNLGLVWPPVGIEAFNPFGVPLLNTIILLSSGISVTWSHHSMMGGDFFSSKLGLLFTIIMGLYFTFLQGYEYYEASFSIADSIYGSTFFVATGFHGVHVIVGTLFLLVCYCRHNFKHFSLNHHFGFEAAVWYWHFVDVVWLFLYSMIYWWGGLH